MNSSLSKVARGDIISADFFNTLIDKINGIQEPGPVQTVNEDVISVLMDAWAAYRGLIKKQLFLPTETTDAGIKARLAVSNAIRDIMDMSLLNAIGAATIQNDTTGILEGFSDLYQVQDDLSTLFLTTMEDLSSHVDRLNFGNILNTFLNTSGQSGSLSLQGAIASQNVSSVVAAQQRINNAVLNWSGGTINGTTQVVYKGSSRGRTLVRTDTVNPFKYTFTVYNKTDKALVIQLATQFGSPHTEWKPAGIFDAQNNPLTSVSLAAKDPLNPNKPESKTEATVWVYTPNGAIDNQSAPLLLNASVPQYGEQVYSFDQVQLTVGPVETPDKPTWIIFSSVQATADLSQPVAKNKTVVLTLMARFHSDIAPKARDFIVKVTVDQQSSNVVQNFGINFTDLIKSNQSTTMLIISESFSMTSDTELGATINVPLKIELTGTVNGESLVFTVSVEAKDNSTINAIDQQRTLSIKP